MAKIKKKTFLFGSGGHAKACIDVIEASGLYKVVAIIYKKKRPTDPFFSNYKLMNENKLVSNYKNFYAIIGIGQIKSNLHRKNVFKLIQKKKLKLHQFIQKKHTYLKHLKLK